MEKKKVKKVVDKNVGKLEAKRDVIKKSFEIDKDTALVRLRDVISPDEFKILKNKDLNSVIITYQQVFEGKERRLRVMGNVPIAGEFYAYRLFLDDGNSIIILSPFDISTSMSFYTGYINTKWGGVNAVKTDVFLKLLDIFPDVRTGKLSGIYLLMISPSFMDHDIDVTKMDEKIDALTISEKKLEFMKSDALKYRKAAEELQRLLDSEIEAYIENQERVELLADEYAAAIVLRMANTMRSTKELMDRISSDTRELNSVGRTVAKYVFYSVVAILAFLFLFKIFGGG